MVTAAHRPQPAAQAGRQGRRQGLGAQLEVVAPHGVVGLDGGEVLAVAAGAAPLRPEMVDQGAGHVVDRMAGLEPAEGELGFEVISHPHEVLVEAPQLQRQPPGDGHVAPHEGLHRAGPQAVEEVRPLLRIAAALVPGLQHPSGEHGLAAGGAGPCVGVEQLRVRLDVVIEEQHPVAAGLLQGHVHGAGDGGCWQS